MADSCARVASAPLGNVGCSGPAGPGKEIRYRASGLTRSNKKKKNAGCSGRKYGVMTEANVVNRAGTI